MLVTDPHQRASLTEIMNHPWMTKGYNGPPDNYLPVREPLQLPLENTVIEKMTGFEFGSPEYIISQLTNIIESEDYQNAVRAASREHAVHNQTEKKRGVFDFYKRRNSASRDTLSVPSAEALQLGHDPLNAYSPLISVYFLAREKLEREKGEAKPGALGFRATDNNVMLKMPDLPAPEAAYTNQYQLPGEKDVGRRSRPRARTHGDENITDELKSLNLGPQQSARAAANTEAPSPKKESTAAGLLRRFSTRKTKDRGHDIQEREKAVQAQTPSLNVQPPADSAASPMHRGLSMRRSRRADVSPPADIAGQDNRTTPSSAPERTRARVLGRSSSVNSAEYRSRRAARRGETDVFDAATGRQLRSSESDQYGLGTELPPVQEGPTTGGNHTSRAMSLGHARRESIQARRARREAAREADLPEEPYADISGAGTALQSANEGEDLTKPVYLKGIFSVSTTSTKPLSFVRAEIIRVLELLSVDYVEIKGGFSCRHAPSITLDRPLDTGSDSDRQNHTPNHRHRFSLGGLFNNDDGSRDLSRTRSQRRAQGPPDRSFVTNSEDSDEYVARSNGNSGGDRAGETTTRVERDVGANLVLKFEILIVKVPLFNLHGIQFKKVQGGMWQYREMAKKILDALRL